MLSLFHISGNNFNAHGISSIYSNLVDLKIFWSQLVAFKGLGVHLIAASVAWLWKLKQIVFCNFIGNVINLYAIILYCLSY